MGRGAHTQAPGAWTMLGEERVKLGPFSLIGVDPALEGVALAPGEAHITKKSVYVGTADAAVKLQRSSSSCRGLADAPA